MKEIKNHTEFAHLLKQEKPILVDFYADWCGPCQGQLPIISELAEQHKNSFEIVKVNIDRNPELAGKFKVRNIPALFFIKDKTIIQTMVGLQSKSVLNKKIQTILDS